MTRRFCRRVLGASGYEPEEIISSKDSYDLIVERGEQDFKSELERFPRLFSGVEVFERRCGLICFEAVERLGENSRHCRLAHTPCPGEQISVCHPAAFNSVFESLGDGILPHNVVKRLRPKPPGEYCISHNESSLLECCCKKSGIERLKSNRWPGLPQHSDAYAYGCLVPHLTRFASGTCMGPDHKICSVGHCFSTE